MSEDFADFIDSERERLNSYRAQYVEARAIADREIANLDREFAAIEAYEAAKTGKVAARAPASETRPRTQRGAWRQAIVQAVSETSSGMTRGELLDALGLKGVKSGEMAVSNALTALTKAGLLVRKDGRYSVPAIPSAEDVRVVLRAAAE